MILIRKKAVKAIFDVRYKTQNMVKGAIKILLS